MTILKGTICNGIGAAHRAIAVQIPHLSSFIDLSKFHVGTINVLLDEPLFITQFDISTPPIKWHPMEDTDRFSFLKVGFQLDISTFGVPVDAVIYHAAASPNHSDPRFIEIMTRRLNIGGISRCLIHVNRGCQQVPAVVLQ